MVTIGSRLGVGPILSLTCGALLPADLQARLQADSRTWALRVLRQRAAFLRFAQHLETQGIRVMVLKGLHLATSVYAHSGLRPMCDVDVLVHRTDLSAAVDAAQGAGYSQGAATVRAPVSTMSHHLPGFYQPGAALEIHFQLSPDTMPPFVNMNEIWSRAEATPLARNALVMCPEDNLLHICAHAATSHLCEIGLRPLCDIRALVVRHKGQLSWSDVASRARQWRCERAVTLVLQLCRRRLGVDIPDTLFDQLREHVATPEILGAAESLALSPRTPAHSTEQVSRILAVPGLWAKCRYAIRRVYLPSDQRQWLYPTIGTDGGINKVRFILRRCWHLVRHHLVPITRLAAAPRSDTRLHVDRRSSLANWLRNE